MILHRPYVVVAYSQSTLMLLITIKPAQVNCCVFFTRRVQFHAYQVLPLQNVDQRFALIRTRPPTLELDNFNWSQKTLYHCNTVTLLNGKMTRKRTISLSLLLNVC